MCIVYQGLHFPRSPTEHSIAEFGMRYAHISTGNSLTAFGPTIGRSARGCSICGYLRFQAPQHLTAHITLRVADHWSSKGRQAFVTGSRVPDLVTGALFPGHRRNGDEDRGLQQGQKACLVPHPKCEITNEGVPWPLAWPGQPLRPAFAYHYTFKILCLAASFCRRVRRQAASATYNPLQTRRWHSRKWFDLERKSSIHCSLCPRAETVKDTTSQRHPGPPPSAPTISLVSHRPQYRSPSLQSCADIDCARYCWGFRSSLATVEKPRASTHL
jgi:hypothetical protein